MAQKVNIVLVDDLDGSEADETVTFGLDGTTYEIDLNDSNAAALREALSGYVGHARKVTGGARRGRKASGASSTGTNTKDVREWAKSPGHGGLRAGPHLRRCPAGLRRRTLIHACNAGLLVVPPSSSRWRTPRNPALHRPTYSRTWALATRTPARSREGDGRRRSVFAVSGPTRVVGGNT